MPRSGSSSAAAVLSSRLIGVLGFTVSAAFALVLPLTYYAVSYAALSASHQTKVEINADLVHQLISGSPDLWRFQEHRLKELLLRSSEVLREDNTLIFDKAGTVVVDVGDQPASPLMRVRTPLFDAGVEVGRIEIRTSLRPLIVNTMLVGAGGLLLGAAMFGMIRILRGRERRLLEVRFLEQERARTTLRSIGDAVITIDGNGLIDYVNPVAETLTGWTQAEARGQPLDTVMPLIDEETLQPAVSPMGQALSENEIRKLTGKVALLRRDGTSIAIDDSAAPINDRQGKVIGGVLVFRDVTIARSMAQRITWAATHDALTGLANRREFENRVEAALTSARNSAKHHVLCFMDLDRFKIVNDTAGHAAGDLLLKQVAQVLQENLRESDTLARLGGDEFCVLLDSCPLERAELIAANLLAAIKNLRFRWEDKSFVVGISIGVVVINNDSPNRAEIFRAADAACYAAKEQGRNRVCVFHRAESDLAERRRDMDWAARLGRAIEENRFRLYYQPYQALVMGGPGTKHIEILLRLIDEDGSMVSPGNFVPAAERYGVMPVIDQWVITAVFSRYHELVLLLGSPLICAINLSGTSLNGEDLLAFIREQVSLHRIPPGAICFEITETAAINNLRRATQFIKDVKALGFFFALDDFGSGTSSFGYLKNLPVDYLKIDGSFVRDIVNDPLDRAMTETINRVGHIMGLKTVAEYAENEAIIGELRAIGVDYAQGYGVQIPQPLPVAPAG